MVLPSKVIGDAWPATFDVFFNGHYLYKTPTSMLLACEDPGDPEAWLVWWAEQAPRTNRRDMLRNFLRAIPYYKPRIRWARPAHNRRDLAVYPIERLFKIARLPLPPKKT
jgi:hypothetical protein